VICFFSIQLFQLFSSILCVIKQHLLFIGQLLPGDVLTITTNLTADLSPLQMALTHLAIAWKSHMHFRLLQSCDVLAFAKDCVSESNRIRPGKPIVFCWNIIWMRRWNPLEVMKQRKITSPPRLPKNIIKTSLHLPNLAKAALSGENIKVQNYDNLELMPS
jgi:hypothetical protein